MEFSLKDLIELGSTVVVVGMFLWYLSKRDTAAAEREGKIVNALAVLGQHLDSMRDHCTDVWTAVSKRQSNNGGGK